ncbi:MAG: nicotinate-nucleotide adenylyltransferase [Candidatus Eisenbacteria bacterium]
MSGAAGAIVFGGSFDPIHMGHLILAECAADALGREPVLFVPAARPPHKSAGDLSPASDRAAMVRLAVEGNRRFAFSGVELGREGRSYAIDTIRQIAAERGGARPAYLIGADSLADLLQWKDPEAILSESEVVVFPRPGTDARDVSARLEGRYRMLDTPRIEISATVIRERAGRGLSIRYLVPEAVRHYIEERGLYRRERGET